MLCQSQNSKILYQWKLRFLEKMFSMIIVVHIRKDFCNVKICFEEALDPSNIIIKKELDFGLIFLYVSEYWASK